MPYRCLTEFLEDLGHAGELSRVEAEVDPLLEVAEITSRMGRAGGPALLFPAVRGHDVPVLTNVFGTQERICRALGVAELDEISQRVARLVQSSGAEGWLDRLRASSPGAALGNLLPRRVKAAACQQIVRLASDVDLNDLPLLQTAPHDAGRIIAAATVFTADPDSHQPVSGRYDLVLLARDRLAICWAAHDEPARLLAEYQRRGEQMPVAVVLGGDPGGVLAAAAGWSPQVDTFALAGLLRDKPLDVAPCRTVDLAAPAEAEIVLEGTIAPAAPPVDAGPLTTPLGYYRRPQPAPVMHVTAATHRANPIYWAMVPGPPPNEISTIDRALARICLPLVKLTLPELIDYDLPMFGAARHWAMISIRKSYAGQARRVATIAWGLRQLMFAKFVVIVDADVDVHDHNQVFAAMAANADPVRDVFTQQGSPDPLDVATPAGALGQRLAVDATVKLPAEQAGSRVESAKMSEATRQLVSDRWPEYGLGPEIP
jgi:4-hydroxy-3-polyprenylbenzoate decarboxylase